MPWQDFYPRIGKRLFDLLVAILAIPLLLPWTGLIALWLLREGGGPVLFRQSRPGRDGRVFTLLKFRTMSEARDAVGELLPDEARVTRAGRLLRRTSLDELPELINVLKGEMSLVGPRPLLLRYQPYFTGKERLRFTVRPGITGWAQVHGRNNLPWDERLALDVWYVQNQSFLLDLKILLHTLLQILRARDVQVVPNLTLRDLDEERRERIGAGL